ncbi:MAG: acyltransferase [Acetobacter sp.]|nr:acyltransferase [Bacteroides sp.]MCM1341133.1 acyltransferase [Acetobacter sp.]MCM1433533.1 acyltransferase [Clostridiales bacterium]
MEISNNSNKTRYLWVDNIKFVACILVVLGHFYMSMVSAKILPDNALYNIIIQAVYTFHVPLFFVCSGFLYQKSNKVHSLKAWQHNVSDKLLNLGVPYFTFSIITLLLKAVFSDYVNTEAGNFFNSLFINPISPYWYLYILFFFFLLIPCVNSKKQANTLLIAAIILKIVNIAIHDLGYHLPYIFSLTSKFIWFAIGMWLAVNEINCNIKRKKIFMIISFITAALLSIYFFRQYTNNETIKSVIGILFIIAILICSHVTDIKYINNISFKFSEYFMPVFLMHTISAATVRSLLVKLGITNSIMHILFGIIASFLLPVLVYMIAKNLRPLLFFFYPKKAINKKK